jgi:sortase A
VSALLDLAGSPTVLRHGVVDASPPPGRGSERPSTAVSSVLLGACLLLVWVLLYLLVLSGLEQGRTQSALYQEFRTEVASLTAPVQAPIAPGTPVALISAPGAGIDDAVVVEGTRPEQLQAGPGHRLGGVLPGQRGTSTIAGRSLSFGAPFRGITDLVPGDPVTVTTAQGVFTYRVIGTRGEGDPAPPAFPEGGARLTLVTAERGRLSASDTVFVDADLAEGAKPAGRVATPDPEANPTSVHLDTTTLAFLALSLQLLVAALAAFAWAWNRWSRPAAWIAVAPCVLGTLWLCSSVGSRLLPGLV